MKITVVFISLVCFISAKMQLSQKQGPQTIALVTGGNKGIGKAIARQLGYQLGFQVVIGCRDDKLGRAAANELEAEGCNVISHHLDLTDITSVTSLQHFIEQRYGKLDILVNNAAICFNDPTLYGKCSFTSFREQAEPTLKTNFYGTLNLTEALLPALRLSSSPRIINIASGAGRLSILRSKEKVESFTASNIQLNQLKDLMGQFESDVKNGVHLENGWPNTCYGMSKLAIIAMTKILARDEPYIMVNSVDPGYCKTDQNANQGILSVDFGAKTPVWLSQLPKENFVTGLHFYDQKEILW